MSIPGGRLPCKGEFIRPPSSARPVTSGSPTSWVTHWPVAFRRSGGGRRVLAREAVLADAFAYDAALSSAGTTGCALHGGWLAFVSRGRSIVRVGGSIGFALLGESLLAVAGWPAPPKGTKRSCPCIRVSLRSTPLIPSTLRGPAYKGHPCRRRPRPFTPLAASMPLAPLRADSIRPPERGVWRRLVVRSPGKKQSVLVRLFKYLQATRTQSPFRWPSVGAAQGDARHGCRARSDGTWMSRRDDPRSSFVGWKTAKHFPLRSIPRLIPDLAHQKRWVSFALPTLHIALTTVSLHAPSDTTGSPLSGGRAQVAWKGLSGMDAARAALGHGWPVAAGPWNVTGAREPRRSRGRMQGQAFLLTFSAFEKSESPSRAKPMPQPTSAKGRPQRSESQIASRARTRRAPRPNNPTLSSMPRRSHPVAPRRDSNEKRPLACA